MPKIVFIRHAESEYNRDGIWAGRVDCSLTEKGIESAKKLGNTIENNLVVNVDGYIGDSTKSEIEYAKSLNKEILYYTDLK